MPLMARILPRDGQPDAWQHYPPHDVVNGEWRARWYYHCHAPGDRPEGEHGHFHCFIGRQAFSRGIRPLIAPPDGRKPRPSLVHIAALAIGTDGLPLAWSATNRWLTDEWLYPASAISEKIPQISFAGDQGDPLVNDWITAILRASHSLLAELLAWRDDYLLQHDPTGENYEVENVARMPINLDWLLDQ